jgi:predicted RNase H-like HicB family nuclease
MDVQRFTVELEVEEDGRWIAEVLGMPGVLAYGQTPEQARAKAEALALRVIADRLEHGELPSGVHLEFVAA